LHVQLVALADVQHVGVADSVPGCLILRGFLLLRNGLFAS
jgi:hypothetical protein